MQLQLSDEEHAMLLRLLEQTLSDLRVEVRRTSTPTYHDELLEEEKRVQQLIQKLQAG